MGQSTEDMLEDLVQLINKLRYLSDNGLERSRNLSLVITNLENAEDRFRRHLSEQKLA